MSLAFPLGLLGLLALPVIAALHMMRERQRRKVVSSLALWAFLEPEVRGSKPRRIPITWLLILDLLIAALFALALSQPHLKIPIQAKNSKQLLLFLDTTTSMLARDESPSRFSRAQLDIATLIGGLGARDTASLVTFGARPHWIGDTRSFKVPDLLSALYQISPGGSGSSLSEAIALGMAQIDENRSVEIHIFSDATFPDPLLGDLKLPVSWHFYGKPGANQAVIDLTTKATVGETYQVFAQLANFSGQAVSRNVTLLVDGKAVDSTSYSLPENSITPQVWYQEGKPTVVTVMLTGGDLLKEDDSASTGYQSGRQAQVVLVEPEIAVREADQPKKPANVVQRALASVPGGILQVKQPEEYAEQPSIDLTVFHAILPEEFPEGVVLLLQPPQASGNGPFPDGLSAADSKALIPADAALQIDNTDPVLDDIDFSGVRWGEARQFAEPLDGFIPLLSAQFSSAQSGGTTIPLLLRKDIGQSHIYLLTADLNRGNTTKHPIFPILLAKLVQVSMQNPLPAKIQLGESIALPDPGSSRAITLTLPKQSPIVFQLQWPRVWDSTTLPGVYKLELEDREGVENLYNIGVNAGSLRESEITPREWAKQVQSNLSQSEETPSDDLNLAPWILGLAVLFLLMEAAEAWR